MPDSKNNNSGFTDQELVVAFIEKRLSDNLAAFERYLPEVYSKFKTYEEKRFFLTYDQNGDINIFDREQKKMLYKGNAVQQCLDNLATYRKQPAQRPFYVASTRIEKNHSDIVNYVHSEAMRRIGDHQIELLQQAYSKLNKKNIAGQSWMDIHHNAGSELPQDINTLIFFSTGLGFDLEKLYLDGDIRHLFLIEPSLDVFYASLQLIDWASILDKAQEKGLKLVLLLDEDHREIYKAVTSHTVSMGRHNMAGAYLYSAFYLDSYKEMFSEIKALINYSFLAGYGFYDDSRYSVSHTLGNIKNNVPFLASNRDLEKVLGQDKLPVFIIGNGPSLDNDIEFLQENQSDALVVSCGSALRALLKNNIQPDVHVELERTAHVPYWIKNSADGVDSFFEKLKKITLIEASQVHPEVAKLFGRAGMMMKDNETGSSFIRYVLGDKGVAVLARTAPTCLHAAVSSMIVIGFKEFYFFGADMGSLDPSVHHSKDSSYSKLKKELDEKLKFDKDGEIYSSNFGDKEVYSSGNYPSFKRELENVVSGWSKNFNGTLSFNNCSDGAFIRGATPCPTSEVVLQSGIDKKECFNKVFDAFFSLYPQEYSDLVQQHLAVVKDKVDSVCDYVPSLLKPVKTVQDVFVLVDSFSSRFHSKEVLDDEYAWLYSVFDGSLLYMLSCINSTAMLPFPREMVLEAVNKQLLEMQQFFAELKADFRDNAEEFDKEERYSMFVEEDNSFPEGGA